MTLPLDAGTGREARFSRSKKLLGVWAAGPAAMGATRASMEATMVSFILKEVELVFAVGFERK